MYVCIYVGMYLTNPIIMHPNTSNSKLETASPFRRGRSKSIDDVHRQMVKSYISHVGAPKTDFPDPKVSLVVVWLWACLRRLGRGSLDYSLLIFHKNNCFRKNVKRAVKSKYPPYLRSMFMVACFFEYACIMVHHPGRSEFWRFL